MSVAHAVQSSFEVIVFVLLIIGLIFEDKVATWERRVFKRFIYHFRKKAKITELSQRKNNDKVC